MSHVAEVRTLDEQIQELKRYCEEIHVGEEANVKLYFLKNLRLPATCDPESCDALLCPTQHNGYPSRLYFATEIKGSFPRNWNFNGRILEQNWRAFSFTVLTEGLSLTDILKAHLTGLVQAT
jgi:hypothetical protein